MNADQLEQCLSDLTEIIFEPSADRLHGLHVIGLVFGRMSPSVKRRLEALKQHFFRERVLVHFRPGGERISLSFIVRETGFIANSGTLLCDENACRSLVRRLHRDEKMILTCYQRDRNGALRFVPDAQYDPYSMPVHFFNPASVMVEEY